MRAPAEGRVMGLRVSAVGDVIEPGEPILDIVPTEEKLVIEAQIRPQDIDYVQEGAAADVRLSAFDSRTTPLLPGTVVLVSADRFTSSESGDSWYVANVEIDAASLAAHPDVRLRAGHAGGAVRRDARAHAFRIPHETAGRVRAARDA